MQDVVQNVTNVITYFMSGLVQRGRMGFPKSSLILILKEINCFEVEKQKQAFDLSPISSETKFTPIFLKMSFSKLATRMFSRWQFFKELVYLIFYLCACKTQLQINETGCVWLCLQCQSCV